MESPLFHKPISSYCIEASAVCPASGSGRCQISTGNGLHPIWSRNGRELFCETLDNQSEVNVRPFPPKPKAVVVSPTGRHVFVAISGADYVTQIDARTNTVIRNITVGPNPTSIQWFQNTLIKGATL